MSVEQLQSLIGSLLHVARCVPPARLFVGRLLHALRDSKDYYLNVTSDMRKDMRWFMEFVEEWNRTALIPTTEFSTEIYVDASGTGTGAHDGKHAYTRVAPDADPVDNIAYLEAMNIVIALQTFLKYDYSGTTIRILCDNEAAVMVLRSGRGKDKVLLDVA